MAKQRLLNIIVDNLKMNEVINEIESMIERKKKSYIVPVNVDVVVKSDKDALLKKIIDEADMVLVDGKPLMWISSMRKHPIKEKVSGSDLVPKLCEAASKKGFTVFILGGKEGVADKAKKNLEEKYAGLNVVGTYSPPMGFEKDIKECEKINQIITSGSPDILIACFGCPKQEKWVYSNISKHNAVVSICAGATVDFLAGNVKRAPEWMSDHGLEWFYRFLKEPKRMFKRYFIDDMKIIQMMNKYK